MCIGANPYVAQGYQNAANAATDPKKKTLYGFFGGLSDLPGAYAQFKATGSSPLFGNSNKTPATTSAKFG